MHFRKLDQHRSFTPTIDKCAIVPILACVFALMVSPLVIFATHSDFQALEARPENRIFWPAMATISVVLAVQNRSRLGRITWPPHIICLFVYLAFAGASVLWAFSPERSLIRFVQQAMIVTSIVLPAMLAARTADMLRGLFLCFAFAAILNTLFVLQGSVAIANYNAKFVDIGYQGYFLGKNYLGECAVISLLLSLHEMLYRGRRRALGIIVFVISILLVFLSQSKTALGLALICPILARLTVFVRKTTRISPAIILLTLPFFYIVVSSVFNFSIYRVSYIFFGDSTLTGRTIIWDFAQYEIARRPLLGWGYQSFWLVPDSPSIVDAAGWVKTMPNAHNGYYDTMLELGYVGLVFLLVFVIGILHGVGRVADRDPARARLLLSLALFVILYNFLESLWMRGFEFLWVVFLIVAAEISRYWQPFRLTRVAYRSGRLRPGSPRPTRSAQMPRLGITPS
ncbi:MAG TPA: O-antigen ligase family protein [Xanthobacteraceae bacterium]